MTKEHLLRLLEKFRKESAPFPLTGTTLAYDAHRKADAALLRYIGDPEISRAFNKIHRWYS